MITPTAKFEKGRLKYVVKTRNYVSKSQNSKFVSKDDLWKYETDGRIFFEYNKNFDIDPIEFELGLKTVGNSKGQEGKKGSLDSPNKRSKSKLKDMISENIDPKSEFFKLGCQTQKQKYLLKYDVSKYNLVD